MKRKVALWALPLVLAALMLGVKWRGEHPTPKKEDWEIRTLILQSSSMQVHHFSSVNKLKPDSSNSRKREMNGFANCFYLAPQKGITNKVAGMRGTFWICFFLPNSLDKNRQGVFIDINVDKREGKVAVGHERA